MDNYRNRIKIEKLELSQDALFNDIETWVSYYSPKAEIKTLMGGEFWQAQVQGYSKVVNIYIRYCKKSREINPSGYRIIYKEQIINIVSVDNVNENNTKIRIKGVIKQ